jgi:flagellum-specific ATP synthase
MLSVYRDAEDLINIGAYKQGANPEIDAAVRLQPAIKAFLKQDMREHYTYEDTLRLMRQIVDGTQK